MKPFENNEGNENEEIVSLAAESNIKPLKTATYFLAIAGLCLVTYFSGGLLFPLAGVLASALFAVTILRSGEILPKVFGAGLILLMWPLTGRLSIALLVSMIFLPAGLGLAVAFKQRGGFSTAMAASLLFTAVFGVALAFMLTADFTRNFSLAELLNNFGSEAKNVFYSVFSAFPDEDIAEEVDE